MALIPMKEIRARTEEERRRLAAGERPRPLFSSRVQRAAARGLGGFLALVLVFTVLSRAADGITVARVEADSPKTGILTQRITASGAIQPQGDLALSLPAGVEVERVAASQGQRVEPGDVLLELNAEGVASALEKLENDMRILDLKLSGARQGNSGSAAQAVVSAQQTLADAREDYDRLVGGRGRTEERAQEDLETAQADYDGALKDLEQAKVKAREALVKTAREKLEAAEKSLKDVKESAQMAIEAAEEAVTAAEDARGAYSQSYYEARSQLSSMREKLSQAQRRLEELMEAGAGEEEIQAAQAEVDAAREAVESAEWNMQSYNYSSDLAVRRAKDELKKVQERQQVKIDEAQAEVDKAQAGLEEARNTEDVGEEALVVAAQANVDSAERALKSAQRAREDTGLDSESQLLSAQRAIEQAERSLADAQRQAGEARRSDEASRRQAEIERLGYQSDKRALQEQIDALQAVADAGGKLVSPIAGTVQSIVENPGKLADGTRSAVISRSDRGFVFEAELDQKQAEKLSAGDKGRLAFTRDGKSESVDAVITGVGAADEKGQVKITASLPEGTYPAGASGTLEVSRRSEQYQSVVPLSAVREDADGAYVLVLREKQTVMGAEQTVERVGVEVLAQDSEQAALETGGLLYDDKVVTSASKPIAEGDKVRLEGENS